MKEFSYVIKDEAGIHARPAGLLVKLAAGCESSVEITKGDKKADAKRIFAIMSLVAKCGDSVTFHIEGPDEEAVSESLQRFCKENL